MFAVSKKFVLLPRNSLEKSGVFGAASAEANEV